MALTFPLSLATFFNGLQIGQGAVYLPSAVEQNQSGDGELFTANLGPRLWKGSASILKRVHQQAASAEALLSILRQAGGSFFAADIRQNGPAADPTGAILGASSPVISTLNANTRDIRLSGLPAGYVLSRGDYLSFAYGSSPVRYAYHQIAVGSVANGSGVTGDIEVTPNIRPGAVVSTAVVLVRPYFKAQIIPDSYQPAAGQGVQSSGLTFSFIQTLR